MLLEKNIPEDDAQQRVDRYIRRLCPGLSLSRLHHLFRKKEIKVEGRPVDRNFVLEASQCLRIFGLKEHELKTFEERTTGWNSPEFKIPILFEDDDLLVLNKTPRLPVHPGTGSLPGQTVIEQVSGYLKNAEKWEDSLFKPSLIHRLDKDTSGVLLVAKSGKALRHWTQAWRENQVNKKYLALTVGVPSVQKDTIDSQLHRVDSKGGGAKSVGGGEGGKRAVTAFKVIEKFEGYALLEVTLYTGRLHQIRTHLADYGNPILGDNRYGNFEQNRLGKGTLGLKRIFLHSHELKGKDAEGKPWVFTADLPEDLKNCLDKLRQ